jgi:DNA repair photolyase
MRPKAPRGRGAAINPANRFNRIELDAGGSDDEPELPERVGTVLLPDASRTIIATNSSPDIPFEVSINPYRGCEHGCAFCYARTFHEHLDLSAGLDFETRIMFKEQAPRLLRERLADPAWRPRAIQMSGVTDPYQPVERRLGITRGCLEVLAEHRHPVTIVTRNALVVRDADLLAELASHGAAAVCLSIATLDPGLARVLEPRASQPRRRLEAMRTLAEAGVPVGLLAAPLIPGLTDHELPAILEAAAAAGASHAHSMPLRLPGAVAAIFDCWLEEHRPLARRKILQRLRAMHGGELNEAEIGLRMRGQGHLASQLAALHDTCCRRLGLSTQARSLSTAAFRRPGGEQGRLFEG